MNVGRKDSDSIKFFILNDRPSGIPEKSKEEKERHLIQYQKLLKDIEKKKLEADRKKNNSEQLRHAREKKQCLLIQKWKDQILPYWPECRHSREVRDVWSQGLPSAVRGQVWTLVVGNRLNITQEIFYSCIEYAEKFPAYNMDASCSDSASKSPKLEQTMAIQPNRRISTFSVCEKMAIRRSSDSGPEPKRFLSVDFSLSEDSDFYEPSNNSSVNNSFDSSHMHESIESSLKVINLDLDRTFPSLGIFQKNSGPYHEKLKQLLAAFVSYQPDIGYVQGMSFIAATLLLIIEGQFDAFVALVHILNRPCHNSLFSLEEKEFMIYFYTYNNLLEMKLPGLAKHLRSQNVEPYIYLYDWLITMFSRCLKLDSRVLIWDIYFLDGEVALFRGALAILNIYKSDILKYDFDDIAAFLTAPMPDDLTKDQMLASIKSIDLTKKVYDSVEEQVRSSLQKNRPVEYNCPKEFPLVADEDQENTLPVVRKKINLEILNNNISVKIPANNSLNELFTDRKSPVTVEWNSLVKEPSKYPVHIANLIQNKSTR